MRRNKSVSVEEYLEARISQIQQDINNTKEDYDKMWYNRLRQELLWIKQILERKVK